MRRPHRCRAISARQAAAGQRHLQNSRPECFKHCRRAEHRRAPLARVCRGTHPRAASTPGRHSPPARAMDERLLPVGLPSTGRWAATDSGCPAEHDLARVCSGNTGLLLRPSVWPCACRWVGARSTAARPESAASGTRPGCGGPLPRGPPLRHPRAPRGAIGTRAAGCWRRMVAGVPLRLWYSEPPADALLLPRILSGTTTADARFGGLQVPMSRAVGAASEASSLEADARPSGSSQPVKLSLPSLPPPPPQPLLLPPQQQTPPQLSPPPPPPPPPRFHRCR